MATDEETADAPTSPQKSEASLLRNELSATTTTECKDNDEVDDGVPYDKDWAWMVVTGCFINALILAGYLKSSGVYFVELLRYFQAPTSRTALLFGIRSGVCSVASFYVMNVIVPRLGTRKTMLIGAFLTVLSFTLSSQAPDLTSLTCFLAILSGLGISLLLFPGEVLAGSYFRRKRALALALIKCGVSVGSMVVPPLLNFMLHEFGLHGALLLTGGLCLHSFPAILLLRPISFYKHQHTRNLRSRQFPAGPSTVMHVPETNEKICTTEDSTCENEEADVVWTETATTRKMMFRSLSNGGICTPAHVLPEEDACLLFGSSLPAEDRLLGAADLTPFPGLARWTSSRLLDKLEACKQWPAHLSVSTLDFGSMTAIDAGRDSRAHRMRSVPQSSSSSCRTFSIEKKPRDDHLELNESVQLSARCDDQGWCQRLMQVLKTPFVLLDFSLFRRPTFRLLLMYACFNPSPGIFLDYLPALATSNGVGETQSALLITIVGGLDFLCRLCGGIAANSGKVRVSRMISVSFVLLGVTCQFVRFMTSFSHFVILAVIFGLIGGLSYGLSVVLMIEYVGLEKLSQGISLFQLVTGATAAAWYPLLGYIRDATGSYAAVYHLLGCNMLLSAGFLACEGMVRRLEGRTEGS